MSYLGSSYLVVIPLLPRDLRTAGLKVSTEGNVQGSHYTLIKYLMND